MDLSALSTQLENESSTPSVLWKAFDVLRAFSQSRRVMTVSEIARRSGLPKSTAYRVIAMLVDVAALDRVAGGYKVGVGMFSLGTMAFNTRYFDASFPVLQRLHSLTGRTVHLATINADQVVYVSKLVGVRSPTTPALVGGQLPAQFTALGKILLAHRDPLDSLLDPAAYAERTTTFGAPEPLGQYLKSVRLNGVAIEREESARGLSCVAAPVLVSGMTVAAVSVAMDANDEALRAMATPVRRAAAAISKAMQLVS